MTSAARRQADARGRAEATTDVLHRRWSRHRPVLHLALAALVVEVRGEAILAHWPGWRWAGPFLDTAEALRVLLPRRLPSIRVDDLVQVEVESGVFLQLAASP